MQGKLPYALSAGVLAVVAAVLVISLSTAPRPSMIIAPAAGSLATAVMTEPIRPIPLTVGGDERKIALGGRLFSEPRLARDRRTSCVSCHPFELGGADRLPRSRRFDGTLTEVNTPTMFNVSLNSILFWDGRYRTVEDHINGPQTNTGTEWNDVVRELSQDSAYRVAFAALYPDGVTVANVKNAISSFERSLITPNARFDKFLRGDRNAITARERAGYELFKSYGCATCHQGVNVGGNLFEKFGVMGDYLAERGNPTEADLGRFNVTRQERDRRTFRVPSLRNVALTPPYFHDASARTLKEAVEVMAKYQLGRPIPGADVELIIAFLKTLTGEYRGKPLPDAP